MRDAVTHGHEHTQGVNDLTDEILARAAELRASGLSELKTQRRLRKEFPNLERHEAWSAAGYKPGRDAPMWYYLNPFLVREARYRRDPRGDKD